MLFLQASEHKVVDGIARPSCFADFWQGRTDWRFECPMLARIFAGGIGYRSFGPICALIDPGAQQADLLNRKGIFLLRHARDVIATSGNCLDDETVSAFAGKQERAGVAAFKGGFLLIEPKAGLLLF